MKNKLQVISMLLAVIATVSAATFGFIHRYGAIRLFRHYVLGEKRYSDQLAIGKPIPKFKFRALDGSIVRLVPRPGHILFVDVFTTWCPDCINEVPALREFSAFAASNAVDLIGIDQQEDAATVRRFVSDYDIAYRVVIDKRHITDATLGIHWIPTAFVIDDKRIVRAHHAGPMTAQQMEQLIRVLGR